MEIQDTAIVHRPPKTAGKFPKLDFARSRNRAMRRCGGQKRTGGCDAMRSRHLLGAGLDPDIDRTLLVRLRDLTCKRMPPQSVVTDVEVANGQAVAEKVESFTHKATARRGALESSSRSAVAWVVATLAIVGFLTAMLMLGIAISV